MVRYGDMPTLEYKEPPAPTPPPAPVPPALPEAPENGMPVATEAPVPTPE